MKRVLLVDDEPLARDRLSRMLSDLPQYQVVAQAGNGAEAIAQVKAHQPDLILMDIRMPGMDGMAAAKQIAEMEQPPALVFCTAYDEYAIEAFDAQAVGYLLKPVRKAQLEKALARADKLQPHQIETLAAVPEHISVKTHLGIERIAVDSITHFLADNKYVTAYSEGREIVIDDSLKALEATHAPKFLRIHRNCLVSVAHIEGLIRKAGQSCIRLAGVDELLSISRRHLAEVKRVVSN